MASYGGYGGHDRTGGGRSAPEGMPAFKPQKLPADLKEIADGEGHPKRTITAVACKDRTGRWNILTVQHFDSNDVMAWGKPARFTTAEEAIEAGFGGERFSIGTARDDGFVHVTERSSTIRQGQGSRGKYVPMENLVAGHMAVESSDKLDNSEKFNSIKNKEIYVEAVVDQLRKETGLVVTGASRRHVLLNICYPIFGSVAKGSATVSRFTVAIVVVPATEDGSPPPVRSESGTSVAMARWINYDDWVENYPANNNTQYVRLALNTGYFDTIAARIAS
jgi:hypothetical protein